MSARFCSIGPEPMPAPTMLRKTNTRVFDWSMIRSLKSSNVRHPEEPASATVVVPARSAVKPSGGRPQSPWAYEIHG